MSLKDALNVEVVEDFGDDVASECLIEVVRVQILFLLFYGVLTCDVSCKPTVQQIVDRQLQLLALERKCRPGLLNHAFLGGALELTVLDVEIEAHVLKGRGAPHLSKHLRELASDEGSEHKWFAIDNIL